MCRIMVMFERGIEIGKYSEAFFVTFIGAARAGLDHARIYLFFWDFQGFQVIAYDTELLFKFNNFTVKLEKKKCLIKVGDSVDAMCQLTVHTLSILQSNGFSYVSQLIF